MADPPKKDLVLEGLRLAYRDDGLDKVTQAAEAMSVAVPRLTDTELKQIADQVAAAIVADQAFRQLSSYLAGRDGRGATASASWWSRVRGASSAKPAVAGGGDGSVAQRLLVQSITKRVFFAVTRKTADKLKAS